MPSESSAGHKSAATGADLLAGLDAFPDEYPQLHEAMLWMEKYEDRIGALHLQAVRDGKLPLRVQHLKNWPDEYLDVPDEVLSDTDSAKGYTLQLEAVKRRRENEQNDEAVKVAVLQDKNDLFLLLTEPMLITAPLLREGLRERCRMGTSQYLQ